MKWAILLLLGFSLIGCLKQPEAGPGMLGGYYELEVANYKSGKVLERLSHTSTKGGAVLRGKNLHVNLYHTDSAGFHSSVTAVVDTNWQHNLKLTHFALAYPEGDGIQEVSGWQQTSQWDNNILLVQPTATEPGYVEINFEAFTHEYYWFETTPSIGNVRVDGVVRAYFTNEAEEE